MKKIPYFAPEALLRFSRHQNFGSTGVESTAHFFQEALFFVSKKLTSFLNETLLETKHPSPQDSSHQLSGTRSLSAPLKQSSFKKEGRGGQFPSHLFNPPNLGREL